MVGGLLGGLGEIGQTLYDFSPIQEIGDAAVGLTGQLGGQQVGGWTRALALAGLGLGTVGLASGAWQRSAAARHSMTRAASDIDLDGLRRRANEGLIRMLDDERGATSAEAVTMGLARYRRPDYGRRDVGFIEHEFLRAGTAGDPDQVVEALFLHGRLRRQPAGTVESFNLALDAEEGLRSGDTRISDAVVERIDATPWSAEQIASARAFVEDLGEQLTLRVPGHAPTDAVDPTTAATAAAAMELSRFSAADRAGVFGKASSPDARRQHESWRKFLEDPASVDSTQLAELSDFITRFAGETSFIEGAGIDFNPDWRIAGIVDEDGDMTLIMDWQRPVDLRRKPGITREQWNNKNASPNPNLEQRIRSIKLRSIYKPGKANLERVFARRSDAEFERGTRFYPEIVDVARERLAALRAKGALDVDLPEGLAIDQYIGVVAITSAGTAWDQLIRGELKYTNLDVADQAVELIHRGWYQTQDEFLVHYGKGKKKTQAQGRIVERIGQDPAYRPLVAQVDESGHVVGWSDRPEGLSFDSAVSWNDFSKAKRMMEGEPALEVMFGDGNYRTYPKTRTFLLNMDAPDLWSPGTVDRHMLSAFLGWDVGGLIKTPLDSIENYMAIADALREIALENNLSTHQVQAIIWHTWRRLKGFGLDAEVAKGSGSDIVTRPVNGELLKAETVYRNGVSERLPAMLSDERGALLVDPTIKNIIEGSGPGGPAEILASLGMHGPESIDQLGPSLDNVLAASDPELRQRSGGRQHKTRAAVIPHDDGSLSVVGDDLDALNDHLRVAYPAAMDYEVGKPVWVVGRPVRVPVLDDVLTAARAAHGDDAVGPRVFVSHNPVPPFEPGDRIVVRVPDFGTEDLTLASLRDAGYFSTSVRSFGEGLVEGAEFFPNKELPVRFETRRDPAALKKLLRERTWATISAQVGDTLDPAKDSALEAELRRRGYQPMRAQGVYQGTGEPSWLVFGMPAAEAAEIGRMFDQESVGTHGGILWSDESQVMPWQGKFLFGDSVTNPMSDPTPSERASALYGANDLDKMFPGGALDQVVPWSRASANSDYPGWDDDLVQRAIAEGEVTSIDPRVLSAIQPKVHQAGVRYYLTDEFARTGKTFADAHDAGNRYPIVYRRPSLSKPDEWESLLLSGHHRAAAALLRGEPLEAIVVEGSWGPGRRDGLPESPSPIEAPDGSTAVLVNPGAKDPVWWNFAGQAGEPQPLSGGARTLDSPEPRPMRTLVVDIRPGGGRRDVDRIVRALDRLEEEHGVRLDRSLYLHGNGLAPAGYRAVSEHVFEDFAGQQMAYRTAAKPDVRAHNQVPVYVPESQAGGLSTQSWDETRTHRPAPKENEIVRVDPGPDQPDALVRGRVGVLLPESGSIQFARQRKAWVWVQEGRLPVVAFGARGDQLLRERFSAVDPFQVVEFHIESRRATARARASNNVKGRADEMLVVQALEALDVLGLRSKLRSVTAEATDVAESPQLAGLTA